MSTLDFTSVSSAPSSISVPVGDVGDSVELDGVGGFQVSTKPRLLQRVIKLGDLTGSETCTNAGKETSLKASITLQSSTSKVFVWINAKIGSAAHQNTWICSYKVHRDSTAGEGVEANGTKLEPWRMIYHSSIQQNVSAYQQSAHAVVGPWYENSPGAGVHTYTLCFDNWSTMLQTYHNNSGNDHHSFMIVEEWE